MTTSAAPATERFRSLVAIVLSFLLVAAGVLAAPPAHAAGPVVSASAVSRDGGTVTLSGSGFAGAYPGIYIGVGPAGLGGFYAGSAQLTDVIHIAPGNADGSTGAGRTAPMATDGTFRVTVTVPAYAEGAEYAVYTSKAHGQGFADTSQNSITPLAWEPLPAVATTTTLTVAPATSSQAGTDITLTASVEPAAAGTVSFRNGDAEIAAGPVGTPAVVRIDQAGTAQLAAVFTPSDPAAFVGSTSAIVAYEVTPVPTPEPTVTPTPEPTVTPTPEPTVTPTPEPTPSPEPTVEPAAPVLSVSKTKALDPSGESLTITAENYDGSAASLYGGGKAGFYIQVGWLAEQWRPSEGAASSARVNAYSTWVADAANTFAPTKWTDNGDGTVDASWSVDVTKADLDAKKLEGGTLAVFTVGAGGVKQAASEIAVPIAFAAPAPEPAAPVLSVSKTKALYPSGETITVTGTRFDATAVSKYGAGKAGVYIQIGWLTEGWRPSEGAASSARSNAYSTWAADAANMFAPTKWTENADGTADFTWTIDIDKATLEAQRLAGGSLAVFTVGAGGAVQAVNERSVAISFADSEVPGTPTPGPTTPPVIPTPGPTTPPVPSTGPETVAGGSLRWGFSSSFVNYITGPIAHGAIAVSGGATQSGGVFQFGQATGSTFDAATGLGAVPYAGSVRFTGHNGVLDVTISNPEVRITGPNAATLYVTHGGSQVAFATLDLSRAVVVSSNGAVSYSNAPASLTATGFSRVLSGYSTTLDPVSFTVGTPAAAPAGITGTVAAAPPAPAMAPIPATPPATAGIELDAQQAAALGNGDRVMISVGGFQPYEEDIRIVVYSTPVLLGVVDADANGVAMWTGSLPASLADGVHTLTFQGSVDRGVEFTLARGAQAAAAIGSCPVEGSTLRWGYKESFRTYIEGIAHGGWELTDVEYSYPDYVWSAGTGSVDPDASKGLVSYGGTIRFTGHDGALDTTLSNAQLELAGDVGYIVLDVSGTTQTGEPVTATAVRFAEFPLDAVTIGDGKIVIDAAPSVLTDAGAAAFGTYGAGDELDPVSATIPVAAECGVVAVAESAPAEEGAPIAAPDTADVEPVAEAAPVWPWIVGGGVLVIAVAIGAVLITRRRAQTAAASSETTSGD